MGWRNALLWVLQVALGLYFIFVGIMHFVVPEGLPGPMEWMYELSDTTHAIAGTAEILGGIGLILPSVTRVRPKLSIWAARGLILVMLLAAIWHVTRGEGISVAGNVVTALFLAYVAFGRSVLEPIEPRT